MIVGLFLEIEANVVLDISNNSFDYSKGDKLTFLEISDELNHLILISMIPA